MSKKKLFKLPFIGFDTSNGNMPFLYGEKGEATVVVGLTNPVLRYDADPAGYLRFHQTMLNVVKIIGEGHFVQKLDVFSKRTYQASGSKEYLQQKYDNHFDGRIYSIVTSYLAITKKPSKTAKTNHGKLILEYRQTIQKILQVLETNGFKPLLQNRRQIDELIKRTLAMDFRSKTITLDNIAPSDSHIRIGNRLVKSLSLIDIDRIDLPEMIGPYIERNDIEAMKGFPVDTMEFLHDIPEFDTIIYNQVVEIPRQLSTMQQLELKKRRHSGIPDPENDLCVLDIERLMEDVARENQLLVNAHFNIMISAEDGKLDKAVNYVENALFTQGIIPSRNGYNQLELYRTALVGNAVELKTYDLFLTTSDAALTFFFKEALPVDEYSPTGFYFRFADRQGVPKKIDISDAPMQGRITNRSKFVCGPSGTGKSYAVNSLVEQYLLYNTDVIIVDVGDSYSGLSAYYGGRYITYKPEKPITMNPFSIAKEEYNIEKKDFLLTLVSLLWKGTEGEINKVESDVISDVISEYYKTYFESKPEDWTDSLSVKELEQYLAEHGVNAQLLLDEAKETVAVTRMWATDFYNLLDVPVTASNDEIKRAFRRQALLHHPDRNQDEEMKDTGRFSEVVQAYDVLSHAESRRQYDDANAIVGRLIHHQETTGDDAWSNSDVLTTVYRELLVKRINALKCSVRIDSLSFNTFYEFALYMIPMIIEKEHIQFNVDEFRYVLKKFYKRGEYEQILNEEADKTLFYERFVIFEIDNIKESKTLFPIVTLVIMDLVLQKMRLRSGQRKVFIIEEAWKALASPLMAGYILYLYKTMRKFMGEPILVTQELGDLVKSEIVKDSIIGNSDTIILLDQSKFRDNYDDIAKLLSIDQIERRKIFTMNKLPIQEHRGRFKDFYMRRGDRGEVYGVEVSMEQYLTFTTEKPEKLAVESYVKKYGTYPEGLDRFVKHLKQTCMSLPTFVQFINNLKVPLSDEAVLILGRYKESFNAAYIERFLVDFQKSRLSLEDWTESQNAVASC